MRSGVELGVDVVASDIECGALALGEGRGGKGETDGQREGGSGSGRCESNRQDSCSHGFNHRILAAGLAAGGWVWW